jgi:23S rRNA pseudouridine2605 synthase
MPRANSSNGGSGRRGSSKNTGRGGNFRSGTNKRRSEGGDSERRSSPRKFSSGRGDDKPFKRRSDNPSTGKPSFNKRGGADKPFKKREGGFSSDTRGYKKRTDSDRSSRDESPRRSTRPPGRSSSSGSSYSSGKPKRTGGFRKTDSSLSSRGERPQRRDSSSEKSFRGERSGDEKKRNFPSSKRPPFRKDGDDRRSERPRRDSRPGTGKKFESSESGSKRERPRIKDSSFLSKDRRNRDKSEDKKGLDIAAPQQTEKIRLNRFIANSGVCSRREADELITMGLISVNGKVITEMGYKVNPGDEVRYEDKVLRAEKPVYILMNKPKGFLTTTDDPQERKTVMQLIGGAVKERIYPVGRLDRNTTGLLLLTNDGDLADKLMHPSYNVKKIYKVELDRRLNQEDFQKILDGVHLEEGKAMIDDLAVISDDGRTVGVEIHIGWNRVVRRIFESLNYEVLRLDRSVYAGLDKKDLGRGEWRYLSKEEIVHLKHFK